MLNYLSEKYETSPSDYKLNNRALIRNNLFLSPTKLVMQYYLATINYTYNLKSVSAINKQQNLYKP